MRFGTRRGDAPSPWSERVPKAYIIWPLPYGITLRSEAVHSSCGNLHLLENYFATRSGKLDTEMRVSECVGEGAWGGDGAKMLETNAQYGY